MPSAKQKRRFALVLIKPSHYDDEGYVIQWFRSAIPSNSLACLYGLALQCKQQQTLGDDIELEIHAFDETNTIIRTEKVAAMPAKKVLGMIDWGIGGIGIVKLIKEKLGNVPVIYFSDTGVTPYGKMNRDELAARLESVMDFMTTQDSTHIVMGCNAASSVIPCLKERSVPIKGVIEAAVA